MKGRVRVISVCISPEAGKCLVELDTCVIKETADPGRHPPYFGGQSTEFCGANVLQCQNPSSVQGPGSTRWNRCINSVAMNVLTFAY